MQFSPISDAAVCTWNGSENSLWNNPANWTCNPVPDPLAPPANADEAVIDIDDTVDLDISPTVSKFTLAAQNAFLTGNQTLTATDFNYDMQAGGVDATLSGDIGLDKTTGGTVTLSGNNTYTGTTTVSEGVLALGADDIFADNSTLLINGGELALGNFNDTFAGVTLASGSISGSGTLTSNSTFNLQSGSIDAVLAGSDGATKTTDGIVMLNVNNTYTGTTTVSEGVLALGADDIFADNSNLRINGGELALGNFNDTVAGVTLESGSISGSGTLTSNSTFNLQSGSIDAVLAGSDGATKTTDGIVMLNVNNTYTGTTTVSEGVLALGADDIFADNSNLRINGGELALGNFNDTVAGVTLESGSISGSGTLTSNSTFNLQSGSIDAVLAGTDGATKTTGGTVTLNGNNTYTGTTNIEAGVLSFTGSRVHTGTFIGNGTLEFGGGVNEFEPGAAISTANLNFSGGTNQLNAGVTISSQSIEFSGGNNTVGNDLLLSPDWLTFSGGTNLIEEGAGLKATNVLFSGGTTDILGVYESIGTTTVNGGVVNFANTSPDAVKLGHTLIINNGVVTFQAASLKVDQLNLTGGVLSGPGDLTVTSALLSGGEMQGPGRLIIEGTGGTSTNLLLSGDFVLNNESVLLNSGNVVVSAGASLTGEGTYIQTAGSTQVDGIWLQNLTNIQAGVFGGNGIIGGKLINEGLVGGAGSNLMLNGPVAGTGAYGGTVIFNNTFSPGPAPDGLGIAHIDAPSADLVFTGNSTLNIEFGGVNGALVTDSITARSIDIQGAQLNLTRLAGQPDFSPSQAFAQAAILTTTTGTITGNFNENIDCPADSNDLYVFSKQEKAFLLTIVPRLPNIVPADVQSLASALQQIDCSPSTPAGLQSLLNSLKPFLTEGLSDTDKVNQFINALRQISPKQMAVEQALSGQVTKLQSSHVVQRMDSQRSASVSSSAPSVSVSTVTAAPPSADKQAPVGTPSAATFSVDMHSDSDIRDTGSMFKNLGLFINGQFEWVDRTATVTQRGYNSILYGVTAGADYWFGDKLLLGLSVGYGNTTSDIALGGGNQTVDGYTLSLFGSLNLTENWYVDFVNGFSYNQYQTKRTAFYTDANGFDVRENALSETDGWLNRIALSTGYDFFIQEWTLGLRARAEYGHNYIAGREERGAKLGMNLVIDDQQYDSVTSSFGGMIAHAYSAPFGVIFSQVNIEWERQWIDRQPAMTTRFVEAPDIHFTTDSFSVDQDYVNVRAAVSAQLPYGGSAFVQYDTTIGQQLVSRHAVNVGIRIEF
ncbi:autotransporter domain-containing protein [Methylotuvimicrobium sp. KM1]|uniref:autotransporter family protein n=1 Tax=Methylotuvimicrobium sp. KM1 TaxID=3377707 RepID=UPI00384B02A1